MIHTSCIHPTVSSSPCHASHPRKGNARHATSHNPTHLQTFKQADRHSTAGVQTCACNHRLHTPAFEIRNGGHSGVDGWECGATCLDVGCSTAACIPWDVSGAATGKPPFFLGNAFSLPLACRTQTTTRGQARCLQTPSFLKIIITVAYASNRRPYHNN